MDKKTKIVATIGLASESEEILRQMIENGMNVARLNFSHGTHEWHGNVIGIIRKLAAEMGVNVGILADLQGPRIRTLTEKEFEIAKGEIVEVGDVSGSSEAKSESKFFQLDVSGIVQDIEIGHEILVEDGLMKLAVREKKNGILSCEVVDGGIIKNHKGVNIPDAQLKISPITEKDEKDLVFSLDQDVDFVAMSFVSTSEDIENLRSKIKNHLGRENDLPQIVAKIERKEAIKNLDEVIEATDAVMVARGDLGIEIETSKVAVLQKEIIHKSLERVKPVIVATQMLNSMIENPRPTRAEVSDVSNAVIDHADAVMLSGESASGKYPVESVRIMADIIRNTEVSPFDDVIGKLKIKDEQNYNEIVSGAYELAKSSGVKAILLGSYSGFTARLISHFRPAQPILTVTSNPKTFNQLALVWGVRARFFEKGGVFREDIDWLVDQSKQAGDLQIDDKTVLIMGRMENEKIRLIGLKEIE